MTHALRRKRINPWAPSSHRKRCDGFNLLELLIGVILLSLIGTTTLSLMNSSSGPFRRSELQSNAQAAIDSDLSRIRKLAEDYTCCAGYCAASQPAGVVTCNGNPNDSTYYYPTDASSNNANKSAVLAAIAAYDARCKNSGTSPAQSLLDELVALLPTFSNSNVTRTVSKDLSVTSGSVANLLVLSYTVTTGTTDLGPSGSTLRVVKILPSVANWCE